VNTNANQRIMPVETPRPFAMVDHYPRRASSRHRAFIIRDRARHSSSLIGTRMGGVAGT
jgi:hypothetical protein